MKKRLCAILAVFLCVSALLPTVFAKTYSVEDTDISLSVDDSKWYVFTRDNIEDNPELDELGISYEKAHDILYNNEAYLDAVLYYEDGGFIELLVRKRPLDSGIANLSNYDDDEVEELAKELADKQNTDEYSVYENDYKYAKLEYFDAKVSYYVCEYVTIVNKDNYTLTFQSTSPFTDAEHKEIKKIVNSVEFDVDTSLKEKNKSSSNSILTKTAIGAVSGGVAGGVIALLNKKRKKKNNQEEFVFDDQGMDR